MPLLFEDVDPPEGSDELLTDFPVDPLAFDDLQILVLAGLFDEEQTGVPLPSRITPTTICLQSGRWSFE